MKKNYGHFFVPWVSFVLHVFNGYIKRISNLIGSRYIFLLYFYMQMWIITRTTRKKNNKTLIQNLNLTVSVCVVVSFLLLMGAWEAKCHHSEQTITIIVRTCIFFPVWRTRITTSLSLNDELLHEHLIQKQIIIFVFHKQI